MRETSLDTTSDPANTPPPSTGGRRFERQRETVDERQRSDDQRRAEARRRALVSAWLRQLSRGG
jgi:hypothetical protein